MTLAFPGVPAGAPSSSPLGKLARQHVRSGETILWQARPSLVGLLPIVLSALGAIGGVMLGAYFQVEAPTSFLRGTPAIVLGVAGVLVETIRRYIRLRFTIFIVTDQRFYSITSFLETNARSFPVSRATAVTVRQGVAGRLFGFWNARIHTYGQGERALEIPAIRDGEGLLREARAGIRRGANVAWLRRGD